MVKVTIEKQLECLILEEKLCNIRTPIIITSTEDARRYMQEKGYQEGYNDPATLQYLEDNSNVEELARRKKEMNPVAVVRLTRLDCIDLGTNEYKETSVIQAVLYDLNWLGANQVILIGRDGKCDLRPFLEPLEVIEDIHEDSVPTDQEISKLHSIVYWREGKLYYKDRSKNGSTVNDDRKLFNDKMQWGNPLEFIGLGEFLPIKKEQRSAYSDPNSEEIVLREELRNVKQSRFKLWWTPHEFYDSRTMF